MRTETTAVHQKKILKFTHLLTHHNTRRKNHKQVEPKHCHVNNTNMHSDYQKDLEDELKKALAVCVLAALAGVGAVSVGIQLDLFAGRR